VQLFLLNIVIIFFAMAISFLEFPQHSPLILSWRKHASYCSKQAHSCEKRYESAYGESNTCSEEQRVLTSQQEDADDTMIDRL
jgi:hypothetical protein